MGRAIVNKRSSGFDEISVIEASGGNSLVQHPRQLETGISEFLLDNGESAFDKREYLNAGGRKRKKKKKVKKVRKKRVRTKDGLVKDILVETEQVVNEDGSPLTKEEVAQNNSTEKQAVVGALKKEKINPESVDEIKDDDEAEENKNGSVASSKSESKPELIFGMKKPVFYGGVAVVGILLITGIALVFSKKKKES